VLNSASNNLNEVVVSGYAVQHKRTVTGATTTIAAKEIPATVTDEEADSAPVVQELQANEVAANSTFKAPANSSGQADQILQGKVAGVTVVNSGQPGANNNTQLRGYSSINNS